MNRELLYETYGYDHQADDPQTPGVFTVYYNVLSWYWDKDARAEVLAQAGAAPASYTGGYAGAPANPYDYPFLLSAGTQVDQYALNGQLRTVTSAGEANPGRVAYRDAAPDPLRLNSKVALAPVPPATGGSVAVNMGGGLAPYTFQLDGGPSQPAIFDFIGSFDNVSPGAHNVLVTDAAGITLLVPIVVPAAPSPACDNPDADNYSAGPNTYPAPAVCTFSPKLSLLLAPPALAALGRPLWVALASAAVLWSIPAPATGMVTLSAPAAGDVLTVNGYRFVVGPPATPDRFQDGPTLAVALLGVPALAVAYTVAVLGNGVVLTARAVGPLGNVQLATSNPATVAVATAAGLPACHSQRRAAWGCWLEVWAVPSLAYPGTGKTGAQLAGRFESTYRTDNRYQFDVSACLRAYTGLAYDCSDRLVGYFLRYGEVFSDVAAGYRRTRPAVAETGVLFGLEAVEIMPGAGDGSRLLTKRPGAWQALDGGTPRVASLPAAGPGVALVNFAGDVYPAQRPDAPVLSFANGQGGRETMVFEGLREEITRLTASLYGTPTGRGTQKSDVPPAFRLHSGPLPRAEWDWLRLELGNSAAKWLETPGGPAPVNVTALTADADEVKGEYTVLVECEYALQPNLGLTN